jgi:hypothetical protein
MTYVAAADFRERLLKPWTQNLLLAEADAPDTYLDLCIAQMATQVELDLDDDFDPPSPDNDETLELHGSGHVRQYFPRRVRSITAVNLRATDGTLGAVGTGYYRLRQSLNAGGTAMVDGAKDDYLELLKALPGSLVWPYGGWVGVWPYGVNTVQVIGKFGWGAVPADIKRLVALRVYSMVKAKADPLTTITQRSTVDAVITYGPSTEELDIVNRYTRALPVTLG